jgi:type I restriction enzyme, S subunit
VKPPAYLRTKPSGVEWLGDIAHDWTVSSIKHLVSTPVTDGPHETPEIFDEGIPFVSAEAVSGGRINFEKIRGHITAEDHKRFSKKYKPRRGDIYLIKSGATTGRVAMVETDIEFNIWSPLAAIRCAPKQVNRHFLFFYMQSKEFQTAIELSWSFGTQQNIGMGVIQNLTVPLPSLAEQQAIAAFLDRETGRVDRLVARKRELIERLKEKRTALISRAVTRGLPPAAARAADLPENPPLKSSGIEWLGDIPKHWGFKKLRYLCEITTGDKDTVDAVDGGEFPFFVRSQTVERIDSYSFDCEAVLTAGDGVGVGKVFHHHQGKFAVHQRVYVLHNFRKISGRYLFMFMKEFFARVALGGEAKSTVDSLRRPIFTDFVVLLPPLPEQTTIAAYLDLETAKLDALMGKVEEAVERLEEYRTALITAAVTGKIDVRQDPNYK